MKLKTLWVSFAIMLTVPLASPPVLADEKHNYEVIITNLTRGQTFTPILVASHRDGVTLFQLGEPASDELAALAEDGDVEPLTKVLDDDRRVREIANSGRLLEPGDSVAVKLSARGGAKYISLAAMLIPTNDAFVALNSVRAPMGDHTLRYLALAYDAGSEPNDELCANIPGPVCGGEGLSPEAGGEDYVHTHAGIHGIGDLAPDDRDWRNPVAEIKVRRVR